MEILSNRKKFVESEFAPENTNVYWVIKEDSRIKDVKEFINGNWVSIIIK